MDEEIDLRAYVAVLIRSWYWIAGLAFAAAAAAFVVSLLLPPTYEAAALVAITRPQYVMQFDERLLSSNVQPAYQAYPALATSDTLLAALAADLGDALGPDERSVDALRGMVSVASGGDPSILKLTVRNGDSQRVARIANRWAELFVQMANDLYGADAEQVALFEGQMAAAETTLNEAELALAAFQARSDVAILEAQLSSRRTTLEDYLAGVRSLDVIVQDAQALQSRLRAQDAGAPVTLGDELAALLLEVSALRSTQEKASFSSQETGESASWQRSVVEGLPIQIQIDAGGRLTDRTVGEQIAFLDSLVAALDEKRTALAAQGEALAPEIRSLQEKLQQARNEAARVELACTVARETYTTLARKVAEVRIAAEDEGDVRLASRVIPPTEPVGPRKLLNTAIGGALGLFLGVFGVFAIEYWRAGKPQS